ncbi:MAG: S-layer homology domain-containing protein [Bacillota bacterium]
MNDWDVPITRYEIARVMVRVLNNLIQEPEVSTAGVDTLIADYAQIAPNFKAYVDQAYMKGLITGMDTQGTFAGDKTGTRAEAATMTPRAEFINLKPEENGMPARLPFFTFGNSVLFKGSTFF